jgi:hypothetical protein
MTNRRENSHQRKKVTFPVMLCSFVQAGRFSRHFGAEAQTGGVAGATGKFVNKYLFKYFIA